MEIKDRIFYITGRVFALALLAFAAVLLIVLASGRTLPFLSENEQDYSIYVTESEPVFNDSEDDSSDETVSDEPVSKPDVTPGFDSAVDSFERTAPTVPVYDKYDPASMKLSLTDISSLGDISLAPVSVRMGFLVLGEGDSVKYYTSDLRDITSLVGSMTLTVERDADGNALFTDAAGQYYYYSDGIMRLSQYEPKNDYRGFDFEYPRYLGVQNADIWRFRENGLYGYRNSRYTVVEASFREAFAFCEQGVGCVVRKYAGVESLIFYNELYTVVNNAYYPPADRSVSSLGYFYFDDGLVRVRKLLSSGSYREIMMDYTGKAVPVPTDYDIIAYSDSRILLGKFGKFGYMTSRLEWITLPEYTSARPFFEGLAVVRGSDGKYGAIDMNGDTAIPFVFDSLSDCSDGLILGYEKEHGWYVFAKTAK